MQRCMGQTHGVGLKSWLIASGDRVFGIILRAQDAITAGRGLKIRGASMFKLLRMFWKDLRDGIDARFLIGRRLDDERPAVFDRVIEIPPMPLPSGCQFERFGDDNMARLAKAERIKLRRELACQFFVAGLMYEGHAMKHAALARRAVLDADALLNELEAK